MRYWYFPIFGLSLYICIWNVSLSFCRPVSLSVYHNLYHLIETIFLRISIFCFFKQNVFYFAFPSNVPEFRCCALSINLKSWLDEKWAKLKELITSVGTRESAVIVTPLCNQTSCIALQHLSTQGGGE